MKFSASWYCHFGCEKPSMPKIPKIENFHIFAISFEKTEGKKLLFIKMQDASIILGVYKQACSKYAK